MIKCDVKGYDFKIFHQRFGAAELLQKAENLTKLYAHFQKCINNSYHKAPNNLENVHD